MGNYTNGIWSGWKLGRYSEGLAFRQLLHQKDADVDSGGNRVLIEKLTDVSLRKTRKITIGTQLLEHHHETSGPYLENTQKGLSLLSVTS